MNNSKIYFFLLFGALAGQAAQANQPPDVVTSDTDDNTAMGSQALFSTEFGYGFYNTGAGAFAGGDETITVG
jgi:hypothetical protein